MKRAWLLKYSFSINLSLLNMIKPVQRQIKMVLSVSIQRMFRV